MPPLMQQNYFGLLGNQKKLRLSTFSRLIEQKIVKVPSIKDYTRNGNNLQFCSFHDLDLNLVVHHITLKNLNFLWLLGDGKLCITILLANLELNFLNLYFCTDISHIKIIIDLIENHPIYHFLTFWNPRL